MNSFLRGRFKAGLLHLSISCFLAALVLVLVYGVWYPPPLSALQGVGRMLALVLVVDLIIGPLLTTLVFDLKKSRNELAWDLSVIAFAQAAALAYGTYSLYIARPVFLVFSTDSFSVVTANELIIEAPELFAAPPALEYVPTCCKPLTVGVRMPDNPEIRSSLAFAAVSGGPDLPQFAQLYEPLENFLAPLRQNSVSLTELSTCQGQAAKQFGREISEVSKRLGTTSLLFTPILGDSGEGVVALASDSSEILAILFPPQQVPALQPCNPK